VVPPSQAPKEEDVGHPRGPEDVNLPRGVFKQQPFLEKWTDVKGKANKITLNFSAPIEGSDSSATFRAPSLPGCMESSAIAFKKTKTANLPLFCLPSFWREQML
jgi:hypothetical protein